MLTWRYVAAKDHVQGEDVWTIRSLYTDDDGKVSWSATDSAPQGGTWMELADDVSRMSTGSCAAQYLDLTLDPPALVTRQRRKASP